MQRYFEINEQGNNISCKIYYSDRTTIEKAVIYCTGFAGHKDNNAANKFAVKLLSKEKETAVVVFNWPAHGDDIKKSWLSKIVSPILISLSTVLRKQWRFKACMRMRPALEATFC